MVGMLMTPGPIIFLVLDFYFEVRPILPAVFAEIQAIRAILSIIPVVIVLVAGIVDAMFVTMSYLRCIIARPRCRIHC
jgi:hypothetical protein